MATVIALLTTSKNSAADSRADWVFRAPFIPATTEPCFPWADASNDWLVVGALKVGHFCPIVNPSREVVYEDSSSS